MVLSPGIKLGPYEIVSPLGAGGMGEVYRARDTRLDRTVAIKILSSNLADNSEAKQRFAHYEFASGSSIHEHFHPDEEVYEVIEGELEVTTDGSCQVVKSGVVAIVPANSRHSVRAWLPSSLIVVDHPARLQSSA